MNCLHESISHLESVKPRLPVWLTGASLFVTLMQNNKGQTGENNGVKTRERHANSKHREALWEAEVVRMRQWKEPCPCVWIYCNSENLWMWLIWCLTALKTPAAFHEQIRSLERARVRHRPMPPSVCTYDKITSVKRFKCLHFLTGWKRPEAQTVQQTWSLWTGPFAHPTR